MQQAAATVSGTYTRVRVRAYAQPYTFIPLVQGGKMYRRRPFWEVRLIRSCRVFNLNL